MTDETRTQGTRDCYNTHVPYFVATCNAMPQPSRLPDYTTVCWERDNLRDAYTRVSGELAGAAARIRELEQKLWVATKRAESAEAIARSFGAPIGDPATVAVNDIVEDLREQLAKERLDRATLVEQHRTEVEKMCAECPEAKSWRRVLEVTKGRG